MSNFKFNEDGPVKVSEECFEEYKKLQLKHFAEAYLVWIDEHYSDGVRRLALRDMVRKDAKLEAGRKWYHFDCSGFRMRLEPDLKTVLKYRPKLLQELNEELRECMVHSTEYYQPTLDLQIETILQLQSGNDSSLWSFHSLAGHCPASKVKELLQLCLPSSGMPEWVFAEKAWPNLQKRLLSLSDSWDYYDDEVLGARIVTTSCELLVEVCGFVELASAYAKEPADYGMIQQIADWLDQNLPANVCFEYNIAGICSLTQKFGNQKIAYNILRRHLISLPVTKSLRGRLGLEQKFLYWAIGLIMTVNPQDQEFLDKIQELLKTEDSE